MNYSCLRIVGVTLLLLALPVATPPVKPPTTCRLVPMPEGFLHHKAAPRVRNRNGTSSNWGGYAVQTSLVSPQRNSVSDVQGRWIVPKVSASSSPDTYSAFWLGIDGADDNTVEQIGTEQDWTANGQQNYAWFEMYPHVDYVIEGFSVNVGDQIAAEVKYLSGGTFALSITNLTQNVDYEVPLSFTRLKSAKRSSAEWIAEAPYSGGVLPLADFGTGYFSDCRATLDGITGPIDNAPVWQYDSITMETAKGGTIKAQPSALADSGKASRTSSFSIGWHHE
jgi:hypothetical protein